MSIRFAALSVARLVPFVGAAVLLATVLALACAEPGSVAPASLPDPAPPSARPIPDLARSAFRSSPLFPRFAAVDACIRDEVASAPGWRQQPYLEDAESLRARWSRARDGEADLHSISLDTRHVEADGTNQALTLAAVRAADRHDWQVTAVLREKVGALHSEGFHLGFSRRSPRGQSEHLTLGASYAYKIHDTEVHITDPRPARAVSRALLASPEALREEGLAGLAALAARVDATIAAGAVVTGPHARRLTAEEAAVARADAAAFFTRQRALLQAEHRALHAAAFATFPFARCWQ